MAGGAYAVKPARVGTLCDKNGEQLLRLEVVGKTTLSAGKIRSANIMKGYSRAPRMLCNFPPSSDYILPAGPGRAMSYIRYQMMSVGGEVFDGETIVPYSWSGDSVLRRPLVRSVKNIQVQWSGGREVTAYYELEIASLRVIDTVPAAIREPAKT